MNTLEKAKIALRKHLLVNKEQAIVDLAEMRRKSGIKDSDFLYGNKNCMKNLKYNNCPVMTNSGVCDSECEDFTLKNK